MRSHRYTLTGIGTGAGAQNKVEGVLSVDGETTNLGAVHLQRSGDVSSLLAVAVQAQGDEVSRGELDGVPFEDNGSLGCIAAADSRSRRFGCAKRVEDLIL